jgi:hypothetical protein
MAAAAAATGCVVAAVAASSAKEKLAIRPMARKANAMGRHRFRMDDACDIGRLLVVRCGPVDDLGCSSNVFVNV